jgi:hypothetical protein
MRRRAQTRSDFDLRSATRFTSLDERKLPHRGVGTAAIRCLIMVQQATWDLCMSLNND